jgi:integrase
MAYIRKRGASAWYVEVKKLGERRGATFNSKIEALEWGAKIESGILSGKKGGIADKTLGGIFQRYHDEESPKKRGGAKEQIRLQRLIRDPISSIRLRDLKDVHFIEWRDRMLRGTADRKPIIGESVLRYMRIINPAIKLAINEWKWLTVNPLAAVAKPKKSRPRDRRPTLEELDILCFTMNYHREQRCITVSQRTAAAMLFAVETGCRAKDLCTMKRSSVNFEERTSRVEWDTKTGQRDISLTTEACNIINQVDSAENGTVFGLTPGQIDANFRKYKKQAGVEGLTFHDMKHEACTRLAKYMKLQELAAQVGTRNVATLMIYYNPTAAELSKLLP